MSTTIDMPTLNEYANSMFRYEHLHEAWLESCAAYCRSVFGDSLRGKTVLDYACGRGNWSIALLRAGAARVYAVDASIDNVTRLQAYVDCSGLKSRLIPLHGNILESPLALECGVFWLYGILHHIPELDRFLQTLKGLRSGSDALVYAYYYPDASPRSSLVRAARGLFTYASEGDFRRDEALYHRAARIRARDDLTAPFVDFLSATAFEARLRQAGIAVFRQDEDFHSFLHGKENVEFRPHHFLGVWDDSGRVFSPVDHSVVCATDTQLMHELAVSLKGMFESEGERRAAAIGLFNTHFAVCGRCETSAGVMFEDALFLGNLLLRAEVEQGSIVDDFCAALRARLRGNSIQNYQEKYFKSEVFRRLGATTVRL
jgi:SAM-dependent methyltransferase